VGSTVNDGLVDEDGDIPPSGGFLDGVGGLWVAPFFCRRTENVLQASQVDIFEDIWLSGQIKRFWPSMKCTTLDVH